MATSEPPRSSLRVIHVVHNKVTAVNEYQLNRYIHDDLCSHGLMLLVRYLILSLLVETLLSLLHAGTLIGYYYPCCSTE
jgi:uncharacterized membrane protein